MGLRKLNFVQIRQFPVLKITDFHKKTPFSLSSSVHSLSRIDGRYYPKFVSEIRDKQIITKTKLQN